MADAVADSALRMEAAVRDIHFVEEDSWVLEVGLGLGKKVVAAIADLGRGMAAVPDVLDILDGEDSAAAGSLTDRRIADLGIDSLVAVDSLDAAAASLEVTILAEVDSLVAVDNQLGVDSRSAADHNPTEVDSFAAHILEAPGNKFDHLEVPAADIQEEAHIA